MIKKGYKAILQILGEYSIFVGQTLYWTIRPPFQVGTVISQMEYIGNQSLSIVSITALFTGMVMALQSSYELAYFGATIYVGKIVALSLLRELGPVLSALMIAGRIASGIAAELGSMKVTEQVDALIALGSSPIKKLVAPRLIAALIMFPLLCVVADVVGILGGAIIAVTELNINLRFYFTSILQTIDYNDLFSGLGKTVFFGFFIVTIGSYCGLTTSGGTVGVGRSTTLAVVGSCLTVLISDFFLTKLFISIF